MKTEQIYTILAVCKGKAVSEIKMLMTMWDEDSIADLAKFFECNNTHDAVAECLSKGLSAVKKETDGKKAEETPAESEESVAEDTDDAESENLSEEKEGESADTEDETEEKDESKTEGKKEGKDKPKEKKDTYKPNLPTGFSFNPLVIAIKPFYDKLIAEDEIFADVVKERESRKEKPKSLKECADYIMGEAYEYARTHRQGNFGLSGFPDEEMFTLIRHYYDEEFIEIRKVSGATASVAKTPSTPAKPKEKPVKNVVDITKAIVSATKTEDGKKKGKAKENLNAGFIPMERPETLKDAKKTSRQQAKSVETIDMFADFFANEE